MKKLTQHQHFSYGTEQAFISSEFDDLQSFINELDLLDDEINESLRIAMHQCGNMIAAEQKRLADQTGIDFLSSAISVGEVKARVSEDHQYPWGGTYSTDNVISITSGYHEDAFNYEDTKAKHFRTHTVSRQGIVHDGDYWKYSDKAKPGVIGLTYEFGRPGKSSAHHRNSEKMKQVRKRIPNKTETKRKYWLKAVPTEVKIDKGTIQPRPHIRPGFDSTKEAAAQKLINAYSAEINKLGD